jgi:hypothetical protein
MDLLGTPKSGFKVAIEITPTQLVWRSQPDMALLYLVLGAAGILGLVAAVLSAPGHTTLEAGLFATVFSPIALFLAISAIRLRARCTVDLDRDRLTLQEQGYFSSRLLSYALDEVGAVYLLARPPSGPLGPARSFALCLAVPGGAYLLAEGLRSDALESTGQLLARFLGVRLEREEAPLSVSPQRVRALVGVLLYAVPVTAAIALLSLSIPAPDSRWVFPTILAAVVLSQVGALLTLLYYRHRKQAIQLAHSSSQPEPALSAGLAVSAGNPRGEHIGQRLV